MGHVNSVGEIRFTVMEPEASLGNILLTIKCIKSKFWFYPSLFKVGMTKILSLTKLSSDSSEHSSQLGSDF